MVASDRVDRCPCSCAQRPTAFPARRPRRYADKLHEAEKTQKQYVRSDEFKDMLEDALRRVSEEPDLERRERLKNIILNLIDRPHSHTENCLFLRLADELSIDAHKVLSVMSAPVTLPVDQMKQKESLLAERAGVTKDRIAETLAELVRLGVIDAERLSRVATGPTGFGYFLTRMGRDFLEYRGS